MFLKIHLIVLSFFMFYSEQGFTQGTCVAGDCAGAPAGAYNPPPRRPSSFITHDSGDDNNNQAIDYTVHIIQNGIRYPVEVRGRNSHSKDQVVATLRQHPELYQDIITRGTPIQVVELEIGQNANGERLFVHPQLNKGAAVAARPIISRNGDALVAIEVTLPPAEVDFRAHNGTVLTNESGAMPSHELVHVDQFASGRHGLEVRDGIVTFDRVAAENEAQSIENMVTGENLDYFTNKNGGSQSFFDSQGDIISSQEFINSTVGEEFQVAQFFSPPKGSEVAQKACVETRVRCYNRNFAHVYDSCGGRTTQYRRSKCQNYD